jgi:hypothetical protein
MKTRIISALKKAAVTTSMLAIAGIAAIAITPRTAAALEGGSSYQSSEQYSLQQDDEQRFTYDDSNGFPMICDRDGNCETNPAYDAFRYRDFAYNNNLPNNYGNWQPAPVIPLFTFSF